MAKTKSSSPATLIIGGVALAYHALAVIKDAEKAAANWQRFQQNPTMHNFLRALLAEGILIEDLGLAG
jgi:hypothetical protein